ncbi:DHCW motif cupin fold protein [Erwiniaceae bacterium BAC15a-03b]|uniref:DHCW motif cupin fold protein n=1 Tax=Winslowiella arboricola TaxID=2978220 RepID=A0A9J6PPF0_9GAMM|nr:DHCW motif cupin fold protein [Winslowiella arboricola]MCU5771764.1 DHCW motif cupin fold protein [Winslowiella arboricola]MCU5777565.1 DHCW motif cupin fold protein [Winslowiella arboricola]
MQLSNIPFGTTAWSAIAPTEHKGEKGIAIWRTQQFGDIRVRMVEYSAGYFADHWCSKGHILLCLSGELHTELEDGRVFTLQAGMSYQVADQA